MRELNSAEIAGVAGGSAIQDPNNPWFQLDKDKDPFHSQAEHGGVTSNFENSSGGVTTVHISGAQLHESGLFQGRNGVIYGSAGDWLAEQQRLDWCAMGASLPANRWRHNWCGSLRSVPRWPVAGR